MGKKGFTLVELLGVITVLAVISLIAFPIITGSMRSSKDQISSAMVSTLYSNGERYIEERANEYNLTEGNILCISVQQLIDAGELPTPVLDPKTGKSIAPTKTLKYKVSNRRKLTHDDKLYAPSECNSMIDTTRFIFDYTGGAQQFIVPTTGSYKIELWGAGTNDVNAGKGAYVSGVIDLQKGEQLSIYVGESGKKGTHGNDNEGSYGLGAAPTFNGGGGGGHAGGGDQPYSSYIGGSSGGGATDIRLAAGQWNESESLKSRIMVAGGGGGHAYSSTYYGNLRGNAGTTNGEQGAVVANIATGDTRGVGATQTTGYAFGIGGTGIPTTGFGRCNGHSGGGGGYFGGTAGNSTGTQCRNIGGGGGSSFVSGCQGCRAILQSGAIGSTATHYSGKVFKQIQMKSGNESMPNPRGTVKIVGNEGNGYARITLLEN